MDDGHGRVEARAASASRTQERLAAYALAARGIQSRQDFLLSHFIVLFFETGLT